MKSLRATAAALMLASVAAHAGVGSAVKGAMGHVADVPEDLATIPGRMFSPKHEIKSFKTGKNDFLEAILDDMNVVPSDNICGQSKLLGSQLPLHYAKEFAATVRCKDTAPDVIEIDTQALCRLMSRVAECARPADQKTAFECDHAAAAVPADGAANSDNPFAQDVAKETPVSDVLKGLPKTLDSLLAGGHAADSPTLNAALFGDSQPSEIRSDLAQGCPRGILRKIRLEVCGATRLISATFNQANQRRFYMGRQQMMQLYGMGMGLTHPMDVLIQPDAGRELQVVVRQGDLTQFVGDRDFEKTLKQKRDELGDQVRGRSYSIPKLMFALHPEVDWDNSVATSEAVESYNNGGSNGLEWAKLSNDKDAQNMRWAVERWTTHHLKSSFSEADVSGLEQLCSEAGALPGEAALNPRRRSSSGERWHRSLPFSCAKVRKIIADFRQDQILFNHLRDHIVGPGKGGFMIRDGVFKSSRVTEIRRPDFKLACQRREGTPPALKQTPLHNGTVGALVHTALVNVPLYLSALRLVKSNDMVISDTQYQFSNDQKYLERAAERDEKREEKRAAEAPKVAAKADRAMSQAERDFMERLNKQAASLREKRADEVADLKKEIRKQTDKLSGEGKESKRAEIRAKIERAQKRLTLWKKSESFKSLPVDDQVEVIAVLVEGQEVDPADRSSRRKIERLFDARQAARVDVERTR